MPFRVLQAAPLEREEVLVRFSLGCCAQEKFRCLNLEHEVPAVCVTRIACLTPVGLLVSLPPPLPSSMAFNHVKWRH